jgi:hypothetical protein
MENLVISIEFDKKMFPRRHTCDGENISPEIFIERIHSPILAIILEDWTGTDERFCQWLIWNIVARENIPENIPKEPVVTHPIAAVQGTNDFHTIGYYGPCPQKGDTHTYYFNVYGLDGLLNIKPGSNVETLRAAMEGHAVQYGGQAIGIYTR